VDLIFHGPIALPWSDNDLRVQGVYWLRIYRDAKSGVVIVTDIPANPGPDADRTDTQLVKLVFRDYLPANLNIRWFYCRPGRAPVLFDWQRTVYYEMSFARSGMQLLDRGGEVSRSEICRAIGKPLDLLPSPDKVLEDAFSVGGKLQSPPRRDRFIILRASSIPPPMTADGCVHQKRFEQFVRSKGIDPSSTRKPVWVREEFFSRLTDTDYQACSYHQADWRSIADESVRLVRRYGECPSNKWVFDNAANRAELSEPDRRWLSSLFSDPLKWDGDNWGNGQHRGCALRASGATEIVKAALGPISGPAYTWRIGEDA
jgi:hypothetical protein